MANQPANRKLQRNYIANQTSNYAVPTVPPPQSLQVYMALSPYATQNPHLQTQNVANSFPVGFTYSHMSPAARLPGAQSRPHMPTPAQQSRQDELPYQHIQQPQFGQQPPHNQQHQRSRYAQQPQSVQQVHYAQQAQYNQPPPYSQQLSHSQQSPYNHQPPNAHQLWYSSQPSLYGQQLNHIPQTRAAVSQDYSDNTAFLNGVNYSTLQPVVGASIGVTNNLLPQDPVTYPQLQSESSSMQQMPIIKREPVHKQTMAVQPQPLPRFPPMGTPSGTLTRKRMASAAAPNPSPRKKQVTSMNNFQHVPVSIPNSNSALGTTQPGVEPRGKGEVWSSFVQAQPQFQQTTLPGSTSELAIVITPGSAPHHEVTSLIGGDEDDTNPTVTLTPSPEDDLVPNSMVPPQSPDDPPPNPIASQMKPKKQSAKKAGKKRGKKEQTKGRENALNKKPKEAARNEPLTPESIELDETTTIIRQFQSEWHLPLGLIKDFMEPRNDSKYSYPREAAERGDFGNQVYHLKIAKVREVALAEYESISNKQMGARPGEMPLTKEQRKKENKQKKLAAIAEAYRRRTFVSEVFEAENESSSMDESSTDAFVSQNDQAQDLYQRESDEKLEKDLLEAFQEADTWSDDEVEVEQEEKLASSGEPSHENSDEGFESDISEEE